ncbi:MAG: threonine-phosphate decarboxylase CobD [Pseudomonas sp.]|uniref:threonine-phosphate decarboxylase CobD n=1 Tax=Pseudomonas sp. TaxID=306 RepID=UPI0027375964|nr:threonine-phosphate decarboxylase CobD [Pseudomonas sp.]MDP3846748.1 threonine-phosphate decarboxylase CobD [Pseudomonas sp.]
MLEHGGRLRAAAQQYGIPLADWLDLSTGLAPWPFEFPAVPPSVWQRLPESEDGLAAVAAQRYGAQSVLPVAGAQAAIQLLPQLRSAGSRVGIVSPCYAEHAQAWQRAGHQLLELSDDAVEAALEQLDVLLLVNPNNPTGRVFAPEQLLDWHERLAARGGWLVVDEAFIDATPELSLAAYSQLPGLIVLRSFGKFYGLAGVRLGFVLAEQRLLDQLNERLGPWAVSGPARWIGLACLADEAAHRQQSLRLQQASQRLVTLLAEHGLAAQGGCGLFQWLHTPKAAALQQHFAQRGILLRHFTQPQSLRFGLPASEADWQRLRLALDDLSGSKP